MTVTTPGSPAPPIICGYNTGQHMYVESSDQCNKIVFNLGLSSTTVSARTWMIRVSQFDSTQESSFVPPIGRTPTLSLGQFSLEHIYFRLPSMALWRLHRYHQELQLQGRGLLPPLQPEVLHLLAEREEQVLSLLLCRLLRAEQRAEPGVPQPLLQQHVALDQEGGLLGLHLLPERHSSGQLRDLRSK